jgi:formylglycine-generating enzyme required for sulfatase activity
MFVLVPAGSFSVGSNGGDSCEKPVHTVRFANPFWICETECTQAAWDAVGMRDFRAWLGRDLPIEGVSWKDVKTWLTKAGGGLRLPSEAEWEYACRARSTGKWCFGDDESRLRECRVSRSMTHASQVR